MWDEKKCKKHIFDCVEVYKSTKDARKTLDTCLQASSALEYEYLPLWYYKNKVMSGSVINLTEGIPDDFSNSQAFEDVMLLSRIIKDLEDMKDQVSSALVVMPFYMTTFNDPMTSELVKIFLKYVEEHYKSRIIFLVRGCEKVSIETKLKLSLLRQAGRALILDSNYQKAPPEKFQGFHAYGCDMYGQTFTEDQLFVLLNKYADYYDGQNQKTFLTGIDTKSILMAAVAAGFTYLSGKAVSKPYKNLKEASFLTVEDIYISDNVG
tara:strand:+ start:539 stop:1333 length:795 start_codon:yes stop_codon:yes gene_type:complete